LPEYYLEVIDASATSYGCRNATYTQYRAPPRNDRGACGQCLSLLVLALQTLAGDD